MCERTPRTNLQYCFPWTNASETCLRPEAIAGRKVCDVAPGPSSLVARRREHQLLIEALRSIAVDDQVILELHYWEQLTTSEMAEVMGIPIGTARGRLQRARTRLEEEMQRLADSPHDLASTMERLDDWAAECRERLDSYRVDPVPASGATARRPASV